MLNQECSVKSSIVFLPVFYIVSVFYIGIPTGNRDQEGICQGGSGESQQWGPSCWYDELEPSPSPRPIALPIDHVLEPCPSSRSAGEVGPPLIRQEGGGCATGVMGLSCNGFSFDILNVGLLRMDRGCFRLPAASLMTFCATNSLMNLGGQLPECNLERQEGSTPSEHLGRLGLEYGIKSRSTENRRAEEERTQISWQRQMNAGADGQLRTSFPLNSYWDQEARAWEARLRKAFIIRLSFWLKWTWWTTGVVCFVWKLKILFQRMYSSFLWSVPWYPLVPDLSIWSYEGCSPVGFLSYSVDIPWGKQLSNWGTQFQSPSTPTPPGCWSEYFSQQASLTLLLFFFF